MGLLQHNVLYNLFQRMKKLSNTLAYAEVELKNQKKASFWTYT